MPLPAIGIGAATLAGSLFTNFANAAAARSQMRFQERMAGSAHQRQVKDLRAAGINPLLGAGGVGAPTPVGTRAQFEDSIGKAVHSGLGAKMASKQLELLQAQIEKEYSAAQLNHAHNFNITSMTGSQVDELNARVKLHQIDTQTKERLLGLVAQHMSADIAQKLASALQSRAGAMHSDAQSILLRLQEQGFRNMSEAQKSWWMREVAPYLGSAKEAAGVVGTAAGAALGPALIRGAGAFSRGLTAGGKIGRMRRGSALDTQLKHQAQNKRDMPSLYGPD